jgi:hypothetical protein
MFIETCLFLESHVTVMVFKPPRRLMPAGYAALTGLYMICGYAYFTLATIS